MKTRFLYRIVPALLFLSMAGCVPTAGTVRPSLPLAGFDLKAMLPSSAEATENGKLVRDGLAALNEGDAAKAGVAFRAALKNRPDDSYLHFLVGLGYHLQTKRDGADQYELAELGYRYALNLDPGNWLAAAQLGRLYYEQKRFSVAQEYFALALLLEPERGEIYHDLAAASYYAGDLKTAYGSIREAMRLRSADPLLMRNASVIMAAIGETGGAHEILQRLKGSAADPSLGPAAQSAIERWRAKHKHLRVEETSRPSAAAESAKPVASVGTPDTPAKAETVSPRRNGKGERKDVEEEEEADDDGANGSPLDKMALIEMVIIRSDEQLSTTKGGNLLRFLNLTYSRSANYQRTVTANAPVTNDSTRTRNTNLATGLVTSDTLAENFKNSYDTTGSGTTNTYLSAVTIPMLTYNLNILNAGNDQSDILARPSLLVEDGKKSKFALVEKQFFTVRGQESGSLEDIEAGIKVEITPKFLKDGYFRLTVVGEASLFQPTTAVVGTFQEAAKIGKAETHASAVMTFDQTLVLSGFNQRSRNRASDGVPFLKDIPGIQYLFSQESVVERQSSILLLLTPRRPVYTTQYGTVVKASTGKPAATDAVRDRPLNLEQLLKAQPEVFDVSTGINVTLRQLDLGSDFFRKFRTGDIKADTWDTGPTFENLVKQAVGFIYY
jgi:general secretion pathway protein D